MPPHPLPNLPEEQKNKLLSPALHSSIGPVIGILIILTLLIFGALFFLNEHFKKQTEMRNNIPYIPSGTTTIVIKQPN